MVDETRSALQSHCAALRESGASRETSSLSQPIADAEAASSGEHVAERLEVPPVSEEFETKTEALPEPAMPAATPPPPPSVMVPPPNIVEDPFADVSGTAVSASGDAYSHAQPGVESPAGSVPETDKEEKVQSGFDAFPPVDVYENGADPFAINGFGDDALGEVSGDDPFFAADAVFTNATAPPGDGFDAFAPSTGAHFDAFGQ